ncbi:MAG TPA: homoserine O-acetyltransferase [Steroidobacteraceae bacterium]|jgi:homoserine O-acetyltransferase|nr:homoserine O-acetyltransferase [Steroidobacteraceae bacterium]
MPQPEQRDPDARRYARLPDPFPMWRGGVLHGAQIAYETWGRLNAAGDNAVLLFTGLSPSAHAASSPQDPGEGWWQRMLGPGLALDTDRLFVICVNSLGSCFGSTGPASIDPATGRTYRLAFPDLAVEDIARGGYEVARSLGIQRVDTVMGPSLGGMVVLAYAALFPGAARRLISISGTLAASPFAIALRSIQREAITVDPDWRHGNYTADRLPRTGMSLARKLGTVTYRSAAEWQQRFDRQPVRPERKSNEPFSAEFAVQGYLDAQARRWVNAFDANCYLYLSRAMDRFDLGVHGDAAAVFRKARLEQGLVIGVESDLLFSIAEQRALAQALQDGGAATRFAPLQCIEGHDSFLIDIERFGREIRSFLD